MSRLPVGYLEMDREDYEGLSVEILRAVYAELREIARYTVGTDDTDRMIRAQNPVTPVDWVVAVKALKRKCPRCNGEGIYRWGACINGRMTHSAPCARCAGKGWMDFDDMRRGRAYDAYAIARAFR